MTSHDKSIFIIEALGIAPKKIAEIINKSQSVTYNKIKLYKSNCFTENDFIALHKYVLEKAREIKSL